VRPQPLLRWMPAALPGLGRPLPTVGLMRQLQPRPNRLPRPLVLTLLARSLRRLLRQYRRQLQLRLLLRRHQRQLLPLLLRRAARSG
jgi:hypothetical protein